ncbi:methylaspartate mutase [Actinomadura rudentiformis]|uniref:Methylaspartate mutase n=1 Tax=Actinomadura rudentiformis TaxID=359158 RepID=A0A6H9YSC5_9ACTN|nr:methylaspartate mutase [Actinomadura rudentiformis]KAB2346142.1 methylaspartate mutase [Actinomadura rudentiformis]
MRPPLDFGAFVRRHGGGDGGPVVQPRMGFGRPAQMRAGLAATRRANATTVGTITLDSYTRVGEPDMAARALHEGAELNGYPIVTHDAAVTGAVLSGIVDDDFPVQIRHGSAMPRDIFTALTALSLNATEGGPISYCLPYGRTPLEESVRNWAECAERFAGLRERGIEPHLETFGGCMLGQLCPPGQLVALSALEALFFYQHGIRSLSVSYAQQTSFEQDCEALTALRRLCRALLPTDNWHVVVYAYMGLYPATDGGAYRLLGQAAELAAATGAERLIVKTVAESRRIPTIEENVAALEYAGAAAAATETMAGGAPADSETYQEALALIEAVLNLDGDVGRALLTAFRRGYLDIPYCLHPDNAGRARGYIADDGRLRWAERGALPLGRGGPGGDGGTGARRVTSAGLLADLSYVRRTFDTEPLKPGDTQGRLGAHQ